MFGCACFPHLRPYNKHKIQFRSAECIYLGPSPQHKGYDCLASNGKIYISKDVLLNKIRFPYPDLFPPPNPVTENVRSTYPANIPVVPSLNESVSCQNLGSGHVFVIPEVPAPSASPSNPVPQPQPTTANTHPMQTRTKSAIFKPKAFLTYAEPKTVKQALANANRHQAIKEEYNALMQNDTWTLVELPQ